MFYASAGISRPQEAFRFKPIRAYMAPYVRASVCESVKVCEHEYLINCLLEFHQIDNLGALEKNMN